MWLFLSLFIFRLRLNLNRPLYAGQHRIRDVTVLPTYSCSCYLSRNRENQFKLLLVLLQDLNSLFKIEGIYRKSNGLPIATKLRSLNRKSIEATRYLLPPHDNTIDTSQPTQPDTDKDTQPELCRKLLVLHAFLSSPIITDELIERVDREVFITIKHYFDDKVAAIDMLASVKDLTTEQLSLVDSEIRYSLSDFSEFTF